MNEKSDTSLACMKSAVDILAPSWDQLSMNYPPSYHFYITGFSDNRFNFHTLRLQVRRLAGNVADQATMHTALRFAARPRLRPKYTLI